MSPVYLDARETLAALAQQCRTPSEYTALIWAQRYPSPSQRPSRTGWPIAGAASIGRGY